MTSDPYLIQLHVLLDYYYVALYLTNIIHVYQHLPGNLCSFPGPLLFPKPLSLQLTLLQYDVAEKEFELIISNFIPR